MKKIADIKAEMGFTTAGPRCGTCKHFTIEKETVEIWSTRICTIDKNWRCGIGGFIVAKSGYCNYYERQ